MAVDPTKAVLFIERNQVRYKQGGMNGIIKSYSHPSWKPVSAVFQGIDVIITFESGKVRRIVGPGYNVEEIV
jgi:hypothetical protein